MNRKKWAIAVAIVGLILLSPKDVKASVKQVIRIGGANRVETAAKVAGEMKRGKKAYVVSGNAFADALSVGPLAAIEKAPILLVEENASINQVLHTLGVESVTVVGGSNAVSENIEGALKERFGVERIAGVDRYETSRLVLEKMNVQEIGVATGTNFPDALAAGALLGSQNRGIQLIDGSNPIVLSGAYRGVYTFGGTSAIIDEVGERIGGANRYDTALAIAKRHNPYTTVVIANGTRFPDALAVTPLAVQMNAPILLTDGATLSDGVQEALKGVETVYIVGGEAAVSKSIEEVLLGKEPEPEPTPKPEPSPKGFTYIDGILLVNKGNSVPKDYAPGLSKELSAQFKVMQAAAKKLGIPMTIGSGYRSYGYQKNLYQSYVRLYGEKQASRFSAKAGYSEHQTGLAIDIVVNGSRVNYTQAFAKTSTGKWLKDNAHRFGFHLRYPEAGEPITGYMCEPWHFRYLGEELATKLYNSGEILETYLNNR